MKNESYKHKSIYMPIELSNRVDIHSEKYGESSVNVCLVKLIELGLIKFEEDLEMKDLILSLLEKMNTIINNLKVEFDNK